MSSLSSFPGLKYGTFFGGTSTLSPVLGFRPFRGSRLRRRKLPNPRSSIFSPRCKASMMLLKTVSTMTSECFLVRSETRETSSTSSALVMLPPVVMGLFSAQRLEAGSVDPPALPVSEVISQRRAAVAGALLVRLPVGAELVRFERANRQSDLPLLGRKLDDLHRVGLADLQLDLVVNAFSRAPRVVELGDVNQALDPLVELDEGAEVRHPDHLALDGVADVPPREEVVPDVGRELLQAERQPLVLGIDIEHHRLDHIALLEDLRRVLHPLAP